MRIVWSVSLPHPHMRQSRLSRYKIFSTPKRDKLACLVRKLSPPPNKTILFVSLEPTVVQWNSGQEYSNKLRGQSCKGPLNATHHASSIHIYRGSQNIRGCPYITLYYFGLFLTHTPLAASYFLETPLVTKIDNKICSLLPPCYTNIILSLTHPTLLQIT